MKKTNRFRGLANTGLAILVCIGIAASIASSWSMKVNELLNVNDNVIERSMDAEDYMFTSDYASGSELIAAEIAYATRLEAEGAVTLKGTPAIEGTKVTLFGMRSGNEMQFGGSMGELIDDSNIVTLQQALKENGFSVNPDMASFYTTMEGEYAPSKTPGGNVVFDYTDQGAEVNEVPVSEIDASLIGDYTDAAIIVLGRDAGESSCFYPGENGLANPDEFSESPTGNILSLSDDERDLVEFVEAQGFGKVIVLLNCATSMEIDELKNDTGVDTIMWIGNPGAYGTYGIAKLLSGELLPSGHLPDTYAVNSALSPAAQNYGIYTFANYEELDSSSNSSLRNSWYLVEEEGIYTGYKYYETRYFDLIMDQGNAYTAAHGESTTGTTWDYETEVSYSFGYGLEGSTFEEEITNISVDWTGENDSTVTVKVTNTGSVAAKHVVQLYVSLPYTDYDKENGIENSAIQLIGYAKTGEAKEETFLDYVLLGAGESEELTITFNATDLYSYDEVYEHDGTAGAWHLESGDYVFATGNGAHEAVINVLEVLQGQTKAMTSTETVSSDLYITEANGTIVENELEEANLNYYGTDATQIMLSRSDWAGTFPESVDTVTANEEMAYLLQNVYYDAEEALATYDGPTEFTYGADNGLVAADLIGLDYDDETFDKLINQMTLEELINQYLAFRVDLEDIAMPMDDQADSPLGFIATIGQRTEGTIYEVSEDDESYGYHTNVYPGGPIVAATFSPLMQFEEGRLIANDALWTGYNVWFAPGMNIHRTPYNGRNVAYYSEDAVLTGMTGAHVHQALNEKGIITTVKHFAFNDQETNRDGIAVFLDEQAAREGELRAFQIGIREGNIHGLMSSFNRIGCVHVAASQHLMNGILRGEWGWNGLLITDSIKSTGYFKPVEDLLAGNDMMLGASNNGKTWGFTVDEVEKEPVIQNGLRESYHRKLYNYVNSAVMNGVTTETGTLSSVVWWVVLLEVIMGIGFVLFAVNLVLYLKNRLSKKEGEVA